MKSIYENGKKIYEGDIVFIKEAYQPNFVIEWGLSGWVMFDGKDGVLHDPHDEFRGVKNRSKAIREKYGDDFYLEQRPRKHRYIYVIGDKKYKKQAKKNIKYKELEYPKCQ